MRRALAAVTGTVAGLAALLEYKSGPPPHRSVAASPTGDVSDRGAPAPSPDAPSTTAPPATSAARGDGSVTGPVVATRFGDVQVQITLRGGRLVEVTALQLPFDRRRSQAISDYVAPILRREALAARNGDIDTVSGATYTSEGYAESLQAALDAARQQ